jgi:hypothetical protein
MANDKPSDPRRSGIYRLIRLVAVLDLAFGLAILLLGPSMLGTDDYRYVGLGLAIAGGAVFAFFTWLAAKSKIGSV